MPKYQINVISQLSFNIEAERLEQAQAKALNIAGVEYEIENRQTERFFFISYNGLNPMDGKGVIGHFTFSFLGMPSLLFMTEKLVQERSKIKCIDVVITLFYEFKSEHDFDDFTVGRDMGEQLGGIIGMN